MSETNGKKTNKNTRLVQELLAADFPNVDVYQYNSASIRVRIIDDRFCGKSNPQRDAIVEPILANLPESIQQQILFVLLLTPTEASESLSNLEFEDPIPSRL